MARVEIIEISPGPDLHLTGPLPDDCTSQTLRQVQLTGHKISGTIPASLDKLAQLKGENAALKDEVKALAAWKEARAAPGPGP